MQQCENPKSNTVAYRSHNPPQAIGQTLYLHI